MLMKGDYMSYKIAICDDSKIDRDYLNSIIKKWLEKNEETALIKEFNSGESFLFDYEDNKDYDILLLDIEMGNIDGVATAKKIRESNDSVQIIFITGYSDYIADGYDVAALNYLMKPVNEEKLFSVLDKAKEKLKKNERILTLEANGLYYRIAIYKIKYVEVLANYLTIHADEDVKIKMTLTSFEKLLDDRFIRIGRSYIVNLTKITRVSKSELRLDDGTILPLARSAYELVNRAIINMR